MAKSRYRAEKAYKNEEFLGSRDARPLRIQSEYIEPEARFEKFDISDTVVFFRIRPDQVETPSAKAAAGGPCEKKRDQGC